ncbi:tetratricopeptide repeat protein [Scytonema sp. PCC 10023]|uniref:tetratricopeptide repeat protein n=1 Tax=Scytonema sp. PCC 10023 TaxID=1680591 RepID=UPI0039C707D6
MTSNPEPNIQQQAENSTLSGGMQAIQGDNNIQLQGNSQLVVQKIFENVQAGGNITVGDITQVYQTVDNLRDIPKPTGFPQNIPSSNTDKFIGRARELERLHEQLQRNNEVVIASVEGMGGVGKTELAIQYSLLYLQLHTYPGGICWLRAREQDIGLQIIGFAKTDLGLQPPEDLELPERVRWCWQHWHQGNTLVVVDDVKNYSHIKPYLPPQSSQFKVLITTRLKLNLAGSLFLEVLQEDDALSLLTELVGEEKVNQESIKAKELVQRLGYLPLALQLVGRYVKKRKISLTEMLRRLEEKGLGHPSLEVKENDSTWTSDIKRGVAAAFELSWSELSESAQELGCLLSLFALAGIPWLLVERAAVEKDAEELEDARVELENLHLLTGEDTYQLHQLIREFLRNKQKNLASRDEQKYSFCQAMVEVAKEIPQTPNQNQITALTPAIPHLAEVAQNLTDAVSDENLIWVFTGLGRFYRGQGLYALAQPWLEQCVSVVQSRLGDEHSDVATSYNNLANLYQSQGRYTEAEPLLIKALELSQRLLGEEHPHVALSYNNLAALYSSLGRYTEAEPLLLKALELNQRLLGDEHPNVALSFNNLANLYRFQGQYTEAEPLFIKALELFQRLLGEEHPDVATSYNSLAGLYHSQGRYTEAEPLLLKALELRQRLLPEEHPDVALSFNNLAVLYRSQKRYTEAELFYIKALELRQRLVGDEHPDVASSYSGLAYLYESQGRYTEAEPLLLKALELRQRLLGEEHPDVATSYNNLAYLYESQGRYTEAEPLLLKALELRQRLLGEEHPDVATSYNNLAYLYESQGRYTDAEPLYKKALELSQRLLGEEHPDIAQSFNNLALLYNSQGRYTDAEPLLLKALELYQRLLGDEHPNVAQSYNNLAYLYHSQGRYTEAEPLYIKALEIAERSLGENHPNTITFRENLQLLRDNRQSYNSEQLPGAVNKKLITDN